MENKDMMEIVKFRAHCTIQMKSRQAKQAIQNGDYRRAQALINEIIQMKNKYKL